MPRIAKELGALEVKRLTEPGVYSVGGVPGLHLQVTGAGSRTWLLRIRVGDKRRELGLGAYPAVTLAGAREAAREARAAIAQGRDPVQEKADQRAAVKAEQFRRKTFDWCAAEYIKAHGAGWKNAKHAQQWQNTLSTYASPIIGSVPIEDVTQDHIMEILAPIWAAKTETASRVRSRIELVIGWAKAKKLRTGENPAVWRGNLDKLLAKPSKVKPVAHQPALPYTRMGEFMTDLRTRSGMGARALEFAILTAARSGEVRGMQWSEIDMTRRTWTVPASRMKAGKEHIVPLSGAAAQLLEALPRFADTDLVFVGNGQTALSDATLLAVTKRMGAECVPHGFRSTFRDWAGETTAYSREVVEHALAHQLADKAEAAYARGTLLEKRRRLMEDWSRFCAKAATPGEVVPINKSNAAA